VLVIARDVIVMTGAMVLQFLNGNVKVRPSWTGKCATALQMVALSIVLLQLNLFSFTVRIGSSTVPVDFIDIPVYLAGLFTAVSGFGYIVEGVRQLQAGGHGDPKSPHELH
jgi:phosphatidylglycerophosphate synthase